MGRLRCAIYTRKSSQEGLEQDFNSLDAQREACEAYVKSQAGEGWSPIKSRYDDGGFSGGTMERPALQRLLADIERGSVDVVVVYKVDRLTRSLADFAKIVEAFDRQGVSFVSVTQAFNTTTSMGRLTLNVLLSFAQFEREVTGERIRDKLAASKAKGMWMGGYPPVGYDVSGRTLVVNEMEAALVRRIFERYLELGSVEALRAELEREGVLSKAWVSAAGNQRGGVPYSRGALFHLLKNMLYAGLIRHKDKSYPGLHQRIVDQERFEAVQQQLIANAKARLERPPRAGAAMLKGLLFDQAGQRMSPSFGYGKEGRVFRYYVSADLQRGRRASADDGIVRRVSAPPLEALVVDRLTRLFGSSDLRPLSRVDLGAQSVKLTFQPGLLASVDVALADRLPPADHLQGETLTVAVRPVFRGGRTWLIAPDGRAAITMRQPDATLVKALQRGHALLRQHHASPVQPADAWRRTSSPDDTYRRRLMSLALLAPDIQQAIVEGAQPAGLTLQRLIALELPLAWEDQRRALGF